MTFSLTYTFCLLGNKIFMNAGILPTQRGHEPFLLMAAFSLAEPVDLVSESAGTVGSISWLKAIFTLWWHCCKKSSTAMK